MGDIKNYNHVDAVQYINILSIFKNAIPYLQLQKLHLLLPMVETRCPGASLSSRYHHDSRLVILDSTVCPGRPLQLSYDERNSDHCSFYRPTAQSRYLIILGYIPSFAVHCQPPHSPSN